MIALADMPWINPVTIAQVADALRSGAPIAAPAWQGQRGHPVGFSQAFGAELAALTGDGGAKSLIQVYRERVRLVDCADPGVLRDIDAPEDLHNSK